MVVVPLLGFVVASCDAAPPLANTQSSAPGVASAVLDALARRDRQNLDALALTEQEFRDHVWPYLPAARPERNLPFSYVWLDLHQKSHQNLTVTLAEYGGRRWDLLAVGFDGETDYGAYRVHRNARLQVRDSAGARTDVRLFGSMIQMDGRWKVFSYVVDD